MSEPDHVRMTADKVFAWIGNDSDGCEGILMFRSSHGVLLPMVSTEEELVDAMRPMAEELVRTGAFSKVRKVVYLWGGVADEISRSAN